MFSRLRAMFRMLGLCIGFLVWTPFYGILLWIAPRVAFRAMHGFYGFCFCLLGMRLDIKGAPLATHPTLFVANHASYTDILVLGFLLPAHFIAKAEVEKWPLIGWIAARQGTLFVERSRLATRRYVQKLQEGLSAGKSYILFPEGTSNDGCRVLPFFSGFLECSGVSSSQGKLWVQPISICYAALDGAPTGRLVRKFYAWTGDMGFFEHLWDIAQLRRVKVRILFHPPLDPASFESRKALADATSAVIKEGFFYG